MRQRHGREREVTWAFRIVARLVITLVALARWRVTTQGLEHVPREGGAVITWHHTSHTDFVMTAYPIYRQLGRPVRFLAMRELWDSRALGWAPRMAGAVPVDRGSDRGREEALRDAVDVLRAGGLIMVAPEGGITPSFEVAPMRTGAARMARAAGVPLIPSASWGTHRASTTGHAFSLRRALRLPVSVAFGEPLDVPPDADPIAVTDEIRARTTELAHHLQRTYPDGAPDGAWWVPRRLGGSAPPLDEDPRVARPPGNEEDHDREAS